MDGMNAHASRDARATRGNGALDPSLKIQVPANIRSEDLNSTEDTWDFSNDVRGRRIRRP